MEFSRSTAVCFTGHRLLPSGERGLLWDFTYATVQALYARGYRTFIAGGALGYDMIAGQAVCELKLTHPDAKLVLALPYPGHDDKWGDGDRHQLAELVELADDVVNVSRFYTTGVYARRNRWMIDHARACVYYLRIEGRSGTAQTVGMARDAGLELVRI